MSTAKCPDISSGLYRQCNAKIMFCKCFLWARQIAAVPKDVA